MKLSKLTIFLSIYIVVSSSFMQQAWGALRAVFGVRLLIFFFIALCFIISGGVIYKSVKSKLNIKRIALISIACIWGFIFAWRQPYFPEKMHVLEFGLLGWLVMRDLIRQDKRFLKNALFAFVFLIIMGYLEEGFQKLLPWRVFEIRDIITDIISGVLGLALFVISEPKPKNRRILYPKQGRLPLFARFERQLSLPLRFRFPIVLIFVIGYGYHLR